MANIENRPVDIWLRASGEYPGIPLYLDESAGISLQHVSGLTPKVVDSASTAYQDNDPDVAMVFEQSDWSGGMGLDKVREVSGEVNRYATADGVVTWVSGEVSPLWWVSEVEIPASVLPEGNADAFMTMLDTSNALEADKALEGISCVPPLLLQSGYESLLCADTWNPSASLAYSYASLTDKPETHVVGVAQLEGGPYYFLLNEKPPLAVQSGSVGNWVDISGNAADVPVIGRYPISGSVWHDVGYRNNRRLRWNGYSDYGGMASRLNYTGDPGVPANNQTFLLRVPKSYEDANTPLRIDALGTQYPRGGRSFLETGTPGLETIRGRWWRIGNTDEITHWEGSAPTADYTFYFLTFGYGSARAGIYQMQEFDPTTRHAGVTLPILRTGNFSEPYRRDIANSARLVSALTAANTHTLAYCDGAYYTQSIARVKWDDVVGTPASAISVVASTLSGLTASTIVNPAVSWALSVDESFEDGTKPGSTVDGHIGIRVPLTVEIDNIGLRLRVGNEHFAFSSWQLVTTDSQYRYYYVFVPAPASTALLTINVQESFDETELSDWSVPIAISENRLPLNDIVVMRGVTIIGRDDGLYTYDGSSDGGFKSIEPAVGFASGRYNVLAVSGNELYASVAGKGVLRIVDPLGDSPTFIDITSALQFPHWPGQIGNVFAMTAWDGMMLIVTDGESLDTRSVFPINLAEDTELADSPEYETGTCKLMLYDPHNNVSHEMLSFQMEDVRGMLLDSTSGHVLIYGMKTGSVPTVMTIETAGRLPPYDDRRDRYRDNGWVTTAWMDFGYAANDKVLDHLQLDISTREQGGVRVEYRTEADRDIPDDSANSWHLLGVANASQQFENWQARVEPASTINFKRIRFRFTLLKMTKLLQTVSYAYRALDDKRVYQLQLHTEYQPLGQASSRLRDLEGLRKKHRTFSLVPNARRLSWLDEDRVRFMHPGLAIETENVLESGLSERRTRVVVNLVSV